MVKKVVWFLFKNPIGTGFLYLAMIFVFSFIYSTLNDQFHHSTIQMEKEFFENKEDIKKDIEKQLKKKFYEVAYQTVWDRTYIPEISITQINIDDYKIESIANIGFLDNDEGFCIGCINIEFTIYPSDLRIYSTDYNFFSCKFKSIKLEHGFKRVESTKKFGEEILPNRGGLIKLDAVSTIKNFFNMHNTLELYDQTLKKINFHRKAQKGIPIIKSGNFMRFLYFSVVTATTLGYGDILPISNTARLLISLESIFGLILIGVFLYNITNRERSEHYRLPAESHPSTPRTKKNKGKPKKRKK